MEEDLIRRYFNGDLSESEKKDFDLRLNENSDFAQQVEEHRSLRASIRMVERDRLKQQLVNLESKKQSKRRFPIIAIAASIAIIFGVGGMLLWNQSADSGENLYAEFYEPYPNVYAPITRDADSLTSLEEAFVAYESGNYTAALKGFDTALGAKSDGDVLFYKAITLIELGKNESASTLLSSILPEKTAYHPQVLWYEALLFLKNDQLKEAKKKLLELDALNSKFKTKKVKELLKKLDD